MGGIDTISDYYMRIAEQLSRALKSRGMTQKHLSRECERRFGIELSQSTISKILNSDGGHMSMIFVGAICQILELDMSKVLTLQGGESGDDTAFAPISAAEPGTRETLIRDPSDNAFFGYIDKSYDIFFWSTHSRENRLIGGTMELSNEGGKYCKVSIRLDNGKLPIKEYEGRMSISLQQQACYCSVESQRLGERSTFVFSHRFFSQESLGSRMASVSTMAVGDIRRPAVHRMFICRQGAVDTEEKRALVASQLLLNNTTIIVPDDKIEMLRQDEEARKVLDALEQPGRSVKYHVFEEMEIRMLQGQSFRTLANTLAKLRLHSVAQHYNKIGGKVDDFLYQYLFRMAPSDLKDE